MLSDVWSLDIDYMSTLKPQISHSDSAGDGLVHARIRSKGDVRVAEDKTAHREMRSLRPAECAFAVVVFLFWLTVLLGGITVGTRPFRCAISPAGVAALEAESIGPHQDEPCVQASDARSLIVAFGVVLLWFTPVNLALVSASAGVLGSFGNLANLDEERRSRHMRETSNPYLAALLRGFFAYLFMISGLLLLDLNPFANLSPGQYIRLAGFLSILSFVINYHPRLFHMLIVLAFNRIEERERTPAASDTKVKFKRQETVEVKEEGIAVPNESTHIAPLP